MLSTPHNDITTDGCQREEKEQCRRVSKHHIVALSISIAPNPSYSPPLNAVTNFIDLLCSNIREKWAWPLR